MPRGQKGARFVYRDRPKTFERLFGTWDIETFGLGGEYADGFTWEGPGTVPERHATMDSLFKALLNPDRGETKSGAVSTRTFEWFAHNGAKYDFNYLTHQLTEYVQQSGYTIETCPQGTKIISFKIKTPDGIVKITDSLPLLMGSLEKVSKAFAPDYVKAGHCEEHDFTKPGVFYNPDCRVCAEYAEQDVVSLWHAWANHREMFIRVFGVEPGMTTGGSALKAWRAMIPKGVVYYRQAPEKERWLRNFCTGAYITPGCTSREMNPVPGEEYAAITADRTAAFAAAMKEGNYPTDAGSWVDYRDKEAEYGFYEVEAELEKGKQPLVPLIRDGEKAWATGTGRAFILEEFWDRMEAHGYKFKVIRGLVHKRVEDVFGPFIARCESLECPSDGSEADPTVKAIVKNMRNSLNGKFNVREEQERIFIGACPADDPAAYPVVDEETGQDLDLYMKREDVDAPYCHPEWYAITVIRQQMHLLDLVMKCEPAERFKCDTDSFTTTPVRMRKLVENGDLVIAPGYGNFKFEHLWLNHQSLGPKNYRGYESDGTYSANCKGIPQKLLRTDPAFMDAHRRAGDGEKVQVSFDSLRTVKEMLKRGLEVPGITRVRSVGVPDTVTGWNYDRPTRTFSPRHFDKAPAPG